MSNASPSPQDGAEVPKIVLEAPSIPTSPDPRNGKRRGSQGEETNGDEDMLEADPAAVHLGQGSLYVAQRAAL